MQPSLAAAEARAIKNDPADLAEIRAIHEDMAALRAVRSTDDRRVDDALALVLDL